MPKNFHSTYPRDCIAPPKGNPKYLKSGDGLELNAKLNSMRNQDPIDKQAPGYDNIHANDWVRGANEDGRPPHFDNSPPRSKMRR
jgi:hypothetical protein